jgi:hypothetical protein
VPPIVGQVKGNPTVGVSFGPVHGSINCIVDTGFSGDLFLGDPHFSRLQPAGLLQNRAYGTVRLADGSQQSAWFYDSAVVWVAGTESVEVAVPVTGDPATGQTPLKIATLLGVGLLENYVLEINFPRRTLEIR